MAFPERGLGRGLGALMGDDAYSEEQSGSLSTLPISQIQPGLKQPRKRFDDEAISELADSIREHGLIQPLTVRRLASGYYQIIAGERRWRASKEAGLTEVPVSIIEADDKKVMELGLIENLQREDLNPMEEANGYKALMEEYGMTQEEVAQRMGKSRPAIANALRLLALPDAVRFLLEEGKLSAGHAKAILAAPPGSLKRSWPRRSLTRAYLSERPRPWPNVCPRPPTARRTPSSSRWIPPGRATSSTSTTSPRTCPSGWVTRCSSRRGRRSPKWSLSIILWRIWTIS